ncbi:hypothetical protein [Flavobacterium rhizosphaerae]|uniref:YD repeat-containing protein n=1 Tax=Flavobacterium rhizosphaerae TaxID=3163298 RepID=A0ABW8Z053_9FLAO
MKKLWLFILAGTFAVACSDDDYGYKDNSGNENSATLLRKKVETAPDGTQITTNYQYDGNKLTTVTRSNGTSESYSYVNMDYLSEIRYYENGALVRKDAFLYGTGSFTDHITFSYDIDNPANNTAIRSSYAWNGTTVTVTEYKGDDSSQTENIGTVTLTVTSNNNVVKFQSENKTISYGFDYQNAPLKEMSVYGLLIYADYKGGTNNITSVETTQNGTVSHSYNTYTYNNKDYPLTQTHTEPDGSVYTTEYFY